jgi:hypothetical protein
VFHTVLIYKASAISNFVFLSGLVLLLMHMSVGTHG